MERIKASFDAHLGLFAKIRAGRFPFAVKDAAEKLIDCLQQGNKILVCGNGGSAADAQHTAGELLGRFKMERAPLPVIALTTNTSVLTAIGNDYDFSAIFAKQVEAFGAPGDVLIAISTSGTSPSIVNAVIKAGEKGMFVIALTGAGGGALADKADLLLPVPSEDTPRIQEVHITVLHILCELVEAALFED